MKKKKKAKKPKKVTMMSNNNLAAPQQQMGLMSQMGSGAGYDFNESVKKCNTIGSEGGFVM